MYKYTLTTKFNTTHEDLFAEGHREENGLFYLILDEQKNETEYRDIKEFTREEVVDNGELPDPVFS